MPSPQARSALLPPRGRDSLGGANRSRGYANRYRYRVRVHAVAGPPSPFAHRDDKSRNYAQTGYPKNLEDNDHPSPLLVTDQFCSGVLNTRVAASAPRRPRLSTASATLLAAPTTITPGPTTVKPVPTRSQPTTLPGSTIGRPTSSLSSSTSATARSGSPASIPQVASVLSVWTSSAITRCASTPCSAGWREI